MRTPKVRSAAGELFWMGVRGVLPLTSISYTSENVTKREGIAHQRHDPAEFGNARSRHRVSIPSGVAGTNLRKTTHYEGKNCDPLHIGIFLNPLICSNLSNAGVLLPRDLGER